MPAGGGAASHHCLSEKFAVWFCIDVVHGQPGLPLMMRGTMHRSPAENLQQRASISTSEILLIPAALQLPKPQWIIYVAVNSNV